MSSILVLVVNGSSPLISLESNIEISDCDSCCILEGYYKKRTYCEKLTYIERRYYCGNLRCITIVAHEMADTTGIPSSVTATWGGIAYDNDSLFFEDIKKWKVYFKCSQ